MPPSGVKYRYQQVDIDRHLPHIADRLVLGVSEVAKPDVCTPFPAPSASQYHHRA